ncbi:PREDICTED: probable receptor-like protein kinase At5g24010 [Prunus mume]|uniref:Probable receptor-like protein kinase At5g24010 n=1 Tax=Prunus mume TaxID=102107 RepID=A0ABM0PF26_PRUMU|nr:PREDICTED: probable receptor-like protein kinase At5g24010 [Prunus mume]
MESFHNHKIHIPLFSLLFFLFHFSSLHFISLAYEQPHKYFVNCGSKADANLNGRVFTADSSSGFLCSEKSRAIESTNQSPSPYQTARIFYNQSYYEFTIAENGTFIVRLHFLAFSSAVNLSTALFDVLAFPNVSNSGFKLLSNFTAKNSSNSPLIKEFFLGIDPGTFKIYFVPQASSFAFVNAIEVFLAPASFSPENYNSSLPLVLHSIYRVNVGGQKFTPDNDTIWRNWEQDDRFLSNSNSAKDSQPSSQTLIRQSVESDGFVGADNDFIAPDLVYLTAKVMTDSTKGLPNPFNITWSFNVSADARHLVRVHFCDIIGPPGNVVFNLYSNGNFITKVGGPDFRFNSLYSPFYYDFVLSSNGSEFINISIGPSIDTTTINNTFLNGLEMLEIIEGPALRNPPASVCNKKGSKKIKVGLVVGSVIGGLSLICILIVGILFGLKYRNAKRVETSEWSPMPAVGGGSNHSRLTDGTITGSPMNYLNLGLKISFAELQQATNNFDTKLLIGEGGFGNVYRGTLLNGRNVAVKRGKRDEKGSGQGLPEFQTEIMVLSKIRHRHLVSLIGYCDERSEMILVYEFMEKGSLRDHLYDSNLPRLSWKQRLEICIGAARGLHYLHTGAAGGIIHRDVKSTNILLDENHVAKVADFGLSRSGPLDETHVSTNVKGTFGYLDPEYIMSQQLTEKSDVYSFGVVLLEVLCARPAIDTMLPRDEMNLAEWGMLCKKKGLLEQIVDSSIKNQIDPSSLRKFSETAEKCLQDDANDRPTMGDVLWDLEYAFQLQQTAKHREPHEDSTANASSAFVLPDVQRFPSVSSTINIDDQALPGYDELDTTEVEVFSQLRVGDAR